MIMNVDFEKIASSIPKIQVKDITSNKLLYIGYYFQMPATTYCFDNDNKPYLKHYVIVYMPIDWGLPNEIRYFEIDPKKHIVEIID